MSRKQLQQKKRVLAELEKHGLIAAACKAVGVSRATFYRWQKEDQEFADQTEVAKMLGSDEMNDLAVSKLYHHLGQGNPWAIRYYLSRRHKEYKSDQPLSVDPLIVLAAMGNPERLKNVLYQRILNGDFDALKFELERRHLEYMQPSTRLKREVLDQRQKERDHSDETTKMLRTLFDNQDGLFEETNPVDPDQLTLFDDAI